MNGNECVKELGQRIKEMINEKGITQRELAKKMGYSRNLICMWCSGIRLPNVVALKYLANEFNTTSDYLLGISDDKRRY